MIGWEITIINSKFIGEVGFEEEIDFRPLHKRTCFGFRP